jgi:hypothetical protein
MKRHERSDDLQAAWKNLVEVCNREEPTVLAWLVGGAIKALGQGIEEAETEVLRADMFEDATAVDRMGYEKTRRTPGEEESRVEQATSRLARLRAELRFLLAVRDRLADLHDQRFTESLRAWFAGRASAQTKPAKRSK